MASYPACEVHPSRKLEIICLEQGTSVAHAECPERLVLQCMQCLNASKCRKHNWKMVEGFIEEVFEVCETEEAKHEKRTRSKPATDKHQQAFRELMSKMSSSLDDVKTRIMSSFEQDAKQIASQPPEQEQYFKTVKNSINGFRRSAAENRELAHLNTLLRTVNETVYCDADGVLSLKPLQVALQEIDNQAVQQEFEALRQRADKILGSLNVVTEGGQTADDFDKERQQLFNHIESLNEQIRQIPVLKQRIEDQAAKLELKARKLQEYEQLLEKQQPTNHNQKAESPQSQHQSTTENPIEKDEAHRLWRANRIQKLLETRDHLNNLILKHCRECYSDTIRYMRLLPKEDPLRLDVGQAYCESAGYLNLAVLVISDELNSLGFSEQVEGAHSITMPLINEKSFSPQRKRHNQFAGGYHPPSYKPMFS